MQHQGTHAHTYVQYMSLSTDPRRPVSAGNLSGDRCLDIDNGFAGCTEAAGILFTTITTVPAECDAKLWFLSILRKMDEEPKKGNAAGVSEEGLNGTNRFSIFPPRVSVFTTCYTR